MNKTPKGKCSSCDKKFNLILQGQVYVLPSHNIRVLGKVNPECAGTGKAPK